MTSQVVKSYDNDNLAEIKNNVFAHVQKIVCFNFTYLQKILTKFIIESGYLNMLVYLDWKNCHVEAMLTC